jgi:Right handed beta helix region/RTX calcium-binding nonapeptide repeat (4 copies)
MWWPRRLDGDNAAVKELVACALAVLAVAALMLDEPKSPPTVKERQKAEEKAPERPLPLSDRCTNTVGSAPAARDAVEAASGGEVVCLAAGSYETVDLMNIDKPIDNRVIFRGVGERVTTVSELQWAGSSGLIIENLRATGDVHGAQQYPADHITFRYMDVSSSNDCFRGIGAQETTGQQHIVIERNYIHDCGEYGIRAQGYAPNWTVRDNRFERIREDYLQSGDPTGWVVDHNTMGPGDFDRPAGYPGHPDIWQTLESGTHLTFTNNLVKDTNQSLGFIFFAISTFSGFNDVLVRNNVFARVVYGVGETCQFSSGSGFVFEQNTLVDSKGCRWGGGVGQPWPDGSGFSIQRNILSGNSSLSCNNTPQTNACDAFEAGEAENVHDFDDWAETKYYTPKGLPEDVGARLSAQDFQGYPFPASCNGKEATIIGTGGSDKLKGTKGPDVIAALGGNDEIRAKGGRDIVCGGGGRDRLSGQGGKDKLLGGSGPDTCNGGPMRDKANCERERSV